eukprot:gene31614-8677_t
MCEGCEAIRDAGMSGGCPTCDPAGEAAREHRGVRAGRPPGGEAPPRGPGPVPFLRPAAPLEQASP